jgi:hypothetical protein
MPDTTTQELQTEITLQDLKVLANLIEAASARGVLKGADLTVVGGVYDKIVTVINTSK